MVKQFIIFVTFILIISFLIIVSFNLIIFKSWKWENIFHIIPNILNIILKKTWNFLKILINKILKSFNKFFFDDFIYKNKKIIWSPQNWYLNELFDEMMEYEILENNHLMLKFKNRSSNSYLLLMKSILLEKLKLSIAEMNGDSEFNLSCYIKFQTKQNGQVFYSYFSIDKLFKKSELNIDHSLFILKSIFKKQAEYHDVIITEIKIGCQVVDVKKAKKTYEKIIEKKLEKVRKEKIRKEKKRIKKEKLKNKKNKKT